MIHSSAPSKARVSSARATLIGMTTLLIGNAATAQVDWTQGASFSDMRTFFSLTYDSANAQTLMFGGSIIDFTGASFFDELHAWDGSSWSLLTASSAPPGRDRCAIAYDSIRNRTLLFGGSVISTGTVFGDTWEWDGASWMNRTPLLSPSQRSEPALAYDSARGVTVLFGGTSTPGFGALDDTWEWDGSSWTQVNLGGVAPSARWAHAMAFDSARGVTVLFGGGVAMSGQSDTWEWDGTSWQLRATSGPPGRINHGMTYDAARGVTVMFGGRDPSLTRLGDVWEWDGVSWTERLPPNAPPPRGPVHLAYDSARERVVMRSGDGFTDTWEYGPVTPAAYEPFGQGCTGSAGIPTLGAVGNSRPWLGDTLHVELGNVPWGSTPVSLVFGMSDTMAGTLPLPAALDPIGMTGCTLYTSFLAEVPAVPVGGVAAWSFPVTLPASELGGMLFQQAFVMDVGANPLGLTASNAARLVVGGR